MEETTEERAQRIYLSEIMRQLTQSERFQRFFKVNYEVQTHINEEAGEFNVTLIERPPELAQQVLQEMLMEHAKENEPSIVQASAADLAALERKLGKGQG